MRSLLFCLGAVLACAACAPDAPVVGSIPADAQPYCRDYTMPVSVGGQAEQATGRACLQGDGSWQVTQDTPGLPQQVYIIAPPPYPGYPDPYGYWAYDPWFYGPFGFDAGIVFIERHHHHDHDHDHHGGHHG